MTIDKSNEENIKYYWIPAFAGMTGEIALCLAMTKEILNQVQDDVRETR